MRSRTQTVARSTPTMLHACSATRPRIDVGLAAAAHDPGRVGEAAGAPRQLGDLVAGLEQPPRPDQDDAWRRRPGSRRSASRATAAVEDRLAVPDLVEAHGGRRPAGRPRSMPSLWSLAVDMPRGARTSPPIHRPSAGRLSAALDARWRLLARRGGQRFLHRLGRGVGVVPGPRRTTRSPTARGRSATRSRPPGGPSRAGRTTRACRRGCRSRARPWPRACTGTTGLPFSSAPWCESTMWSTARASSGGKPSIRSIVRAHDVVAERDLAQQLAVVGEVDRDRVGARRPRSSRCRGSARRSRRGRGRRPGRSPTPRSRPGPPTASARAARAGRPGGRTSPPARARKRFHTSESLADQSASSSWRSYGLRTVPIRRRRSASIWSTLAAGASIRSASR